MAGEAAALAVGTTNGYARRLMASAEVVDVGRIVWHTDVAWVLSVVARVDTVAGVGTPGARLAVVGSDPAL